MSIAHDLCICVSLFFDTCPYLQQCAENLCSFLNYASVVLIFHFEQWKRTWSPTKIRVDVRIRILVLKGKGKWIHAYRLRTSMLPFFIELCIWFRSFLDLLFVTSCPYYVRLSWAFVNFLNLIIDHTLISYNMSIMRP